MTSRQVATTRNLTARCLIAVSLIAALSLVSYVVLREEIRAGESIAAVLNATGRQRTLLQHSALLAQEFVTSADEDRRQQARLELLTAVQQLESVHHRIIGEETEKAAVEANAITLPPVDRETFSRIRGIYFDAPWLLDTEIRNYIAQARALANSPPEDLHAGNPHYQYVRDVALLRSVLSALDEVVATYQTRSEADMAHLRRLAYWSLVSTYVVLIMTVVFVFRPMVHRVRREMGALEDLTGTLEERVSERTAVAEDRARALARSESLYHSLVENLPVYIIRKDAAGRFQYANNLFCELAGLPLDDLVGLTDDDLYDSSLARKYREDDRRVFETGENHAGIERHVTPGGERRFVDVRKTLVRDADGNPSGTQSMFWDVTDRMLAEQERERMRAQLLQSERLAAIGEMVAGVAHESRNSLQQIQACSQLLEWQLNGDGETRQLVSDIRHAHDRLHRLFDDLRGYAAPLRLDRRPADVAEIIRAAWRSVAALVQQAPDALMETRATDSTECPVDALKLEQVFRNVLENSIAASNGKVHVRITYGDAEIDGRSALRVVVRDQGPGLTEEQRSRIFEPFYSTKTEGTGLGMALAKRIIDAHGGRIEVGDASPGAEIIVTVPREAGPVCRTAPVSDEHTRNVPPGTRDLHWSSHGTHLENRHRGR